MSNFLPSIWFRFDENRVNGIGDKVFAILDAGESNFTKQSEAIMTSESLKIVIDEDTQPPIKDGDILLSSSYYFIYNEKESSINKIDRDTFNSMIKI
jgi:hypothetical protein